MSRSESEETEGSQEQEDLRDLKQDLPEFPLTDEITADSLSEIAEVPSHPGQCAYVRINLHDKQVSDINVLAAYSYIQFVDISDNCLSDISPLHSLTYLTTLNADKNLLTSAQLNEFPYLQRASFALNRIATTAGIRHPYLERLNLNGNRIMEVTGLEGLEELRVLELRSNQLVSTKGLRNLPGLQKLYLAANNIMSLEDIDTLHGLQTLHLRENKLRQLDGFGEQMINLQYINMRDNEEIADLVEVEKLRCLPNLRALLLKGCEVTELPNYRMEVLSRIRRLERLDKDGFEEEERLDAEEMFEARNNESNDQVPEETDQ